MWPVGASTEDMRSRLPWGMTLPEPFGALFDWIEQQGLLRSSERFESDHYGSLQPLERPYRGTVILFRVETPAQAAESARWLGGSGNDPAMARRLVPFARTGGDGSRAAFWIDEGAQRIVHLGSEGLACELGRTSLDFLRLCAIGYAEISGDMMEAPGLPPGPECTNNNAPFVDWLTTTYGVTIPATASEIIGELPPPDATDWPDPFWRWTHAWQLG